MLFPIKETFFKKFSDDEFEFIHASATALDTTTKTVTLSTTKSVTYDYLVIATGTYTAAVESGFPVKSPVTDTIIDTIHSSQAKIANASTIVIGGGGAVAIELAGEIATAYPKKKVTMVSGSKRLVPILSEKASALALKQLTAVGVEVLLGVKVLGTSEAKSGTVELDSGKVIDAELYIPAVGVIPNNSFIPAAILDDKGYLQIDDEEKVPGVEGIYGIGDITTNPAKMAVTCTHMIAVVLANLKNDILKTGKRKQYKAAKTTMLIPIGGKGGVAQMGDMGGIILWNWLTWLIKGNYFLGMPLAISGFKKQ